MFINFWWKCKSVKPFNKTSWQYLIKCGLYIFSNLKSLLLDIYNNKYLHSSQRVRYKFVYYSNNSILLQTHCFYKQHVGGNRDICLSAAAQTYWMYGQCHKQTSGHCTEYKGKELNTIYSKRPLMKIKNSTQRTHEISDG